MRGSSVRIHLVPTGALGMSVVVADDGTRATLWDDGAAWMYLENGEIAPLAAGRGFVGLSRDASSGVTRDGDVIALGTGARVGGVPQVERYKQLVPSNDGRVVLATEALPFGRGRRHRVVESATSRIIGEHVDARFGDLKPSHDFSRFAIRSNQTRLWTPATGELERLRFSKDAFCEFTHDLGEARALVRKLAKGGDHRDQLADEYSVERWTQAEKRVRSVPLTPLAGFNRSWFTARAGSLVGHHVFRQHTGLTVSEVDEGRVTHEVDLGPHGAVHSHGTLPAIVTSQSGAWAAMAVETLTGEPFNPTPVATRVALLNLEARGSRLRFVDSLSAACVWKPLAVSEGWLVAIDITGSDTWRPRRIAHVTWDHSERGG